MLRTYLSLYETGDYWTKGRTKKRLKHNWSRDEGIFVVLPFVPQSPVPHNGIFTPAPPRHLRSFHVYHDWYKIMRWSVVMKVKSAFQDEMFEPKYSCVRRKTLPLRWTGLACRCRGPAQFVKAHLPLGRFQRQEADEYTARSRYM